MSSACVIATPLESVITALNNKDSNLVQQIFSNQRTDLDRLIVIELINRHFCCHLVFLSNAVDRYMLKVFAENVTDGEYRDLLTGTLQCVKRVVSERCRPAVSSSSAMTDDRDEMEKLFMQALTDQKIERVRDFFLSTEQNHRKEFGKKVDDYLDERQRVYLEEVTSVENLNRIVTEVQNEIHDSNPFFLNLNRNNARIEKLEAVAQQRFQEMGQETTFIRELAAFRFFSSQEESVQQLAFSHFYYWSNGTDKIRGIILEERLSSYY